VAGSLEVNEAVESEHLVLEPGGRRFKSSSVCSEALSEYAIAMANTTKLKTAIGAVSDRIICNCYRGRMVAESLGLRSVFARR
jgi:hypothetical protein